MSERAYLSEKYTTLPDATASDGKVVQYIGATTADYVYGYFYKAVNGTWVAEDVQAYPIVEKKFALRAPTSGSGTRQENTICMGMYSETVGSMLTPGTVITSISIDSTSTQSVSGDNVRMVLWANDGGDHGKDHNKMIGWSVDTPVQRSGAGLSTTWTFDKVVLPSNFKRLILQLEPSSVSIDYIKNFEWGTQNCYTNLSVAYDVKSGDDGNQFLDKNRNAFLWGVVIRGSVTTYATSVVGQEDIDATINPVKDDVYVVKTSVDGIKDEVETLTNEVGKKADADDVIFDGDNEGKTIALLQKDDPTDQTRGFKQYTYGAQYTVEYDGCKYFIIPGTEFPYASIYQVRLFASGSYSSTDKVKLVLWDYDGSGEVTDATCKYMCCSDASAVQSKSGAVWQFSSDAHWLGFTLPKEHSLIVQGIPESVAADSSWTWSGKGSMYSVLSLKVHGAAEDKGFIINAGSGDVAYSETSCSIIVSPIKYSSLTDGGVDVVYGRSATKADVNAAYKVGGKGIADILLDGIPSGVVPETRKVNGYELSKDITLYGTDIKAKEGSADTIQEAALADATNAIKKYGEETYSFGDGASVEFTVCRYFVLPFSKFSASTISSISLTAPTAVDQDIPKRLVLWSHDGTGILSDDTCKFLGYSSNRKWQVEGEVATWAFDGISLPNGRGLVVQGVPDGETIDESWTWYDKSVAYEVLSVKAKTVEDQKSIVDVGGALKVGNEVLCSIVAVPRAEQIIKNVDVDVSSLVPNTRKVNEKALTNDITLTGEDVKVDGSDEAKTVAEAIGEKYDDTDDLTPYWFGYNGASGDKFASIKYASLAVGHIPSGKISSVAVMASPSSGGGSGNKHLVLWEHDGSGTYSSAHISFLGKSITAQTQTAGMMSVWMFDNIVLHEGNGLVIQGVAEDATPTGDEWDWDADSGRYNILSVKSQNAGDGCLINSGGTAFNGHELYCQVCIGKLITNSFVCSNEADYNQVNLGQTAISSTNKLVVLKPNQLGTHPGVVSPSASSVPSDKTALDTAISESAKGTIKAYAPTATTTQLGLVKASAEAVPGDKALADTYMDNGAIKTIIPTKLSQFDNAEGDEGYAMRKEVYAAVRCVVRTVTATADNYTFDIQDGEYLSVLNDGTCKETVIVNLPDDNIEHTMVCFVDAHTTVKLVPKFDENEALSKTVIPWIDTASGIGSAVVKCEGTPIQLSYLTESHTLWRYTVIDYMQYWDRFLHIDKRDSVVALTYAKASWDLEYTFFG